MPKTPEKIFLISPVREITPEIHRRIAIYVATQEANGHKVHWPERDTPQNEDPIGTTICSINGRAIKDATQVHIWYNPKSKGSLFDSGMAFILGKRLVIANPEDLNPTQGKSLENVLLDWALNSNNPFRK